MVGGGEKQGMKVLRVWVEIITSAFTWQEARDRLLRGGPAHVLRSIYRGLSGGVYVGVDARRAQDLLKYKKIDLMV